MSDDLNYDRIDVDSPEQSVVASEDHQIENNLNPPPIDHQGLRTDNIQPEQEEVVYTVQEEPIFNRTRALFVGNLRKPLNANDFQNYLKELVTNQSNGVIERAWLNRSRTHGIVLVDREEGAEYIRSQLNGSIYPLEEEDMKLREIHDLKEQERYDQELAEFESKQAADKVGENETETSDEIEGKPELPRELVVDRIPLFVDYIPVKAINQWIFEEDKGPHNGQWKVIYEGESENLVATHTLLNGDFIPRYNSRGGRRGGNGRGGARGDRRGRGNGGYYDRNSGYRGGYDRRSSRDEYERRGSRDEYERRRSRDEGYNIYPSGPRSYGRGGGPGGPLLSRPTSRRPRGERDTYIPSRRPRADTYVPGRDNNQYDGYRERSRDRTDRRDRDRSRSPSGF